MGSCAARGLRSQTAVLVTQRQSRGSTPVSQASTDAASLLKAAVDGIESEAEAPKDATKDDSASPASGGRAAAGALPGVLDAFPGAVHRTAVVGASISGPAASGSLQGPFADRPVGGDGREALASIGVGCACKKGLKAEVPNQDDFCIFRADEVCILGVFDGHGPYGHIIASLVRDLLPKLLVQDSAFSTDLGKALDTAFAQVQGYCFDLQTSLEFDCSISGTTATVVVIREGAMHVAHVGNSRAVLATMRDAEVACWDLTSDHSAGRDDERRRIQAAGGQVRRLEGDDAHRVFIPGRMYPGLALTRSIGDAVAAIAGVSCEPEVTCFGVQQDWGFVLVCSDGVWELVSSQEAVDIISGYPAGEVQSAVDALASEAWARWLEEEGDMADNITVICVWFHAS